MIDKTEGEVNFKKLAEIVVELVLHTATWPWSTTTTAFSSV